MSQPFQTPILFIIFNRPDTTKRVFEAIRKAKPTKLYVVADGPRSDRAGELQKCLETRDIIKTVDWDCEVITDYSEVNLGCKMRVSSGIDWFFRNEESGIILEDDCLPDQSFFPFCDVLLTKYKEDNRVGMISGNNFQFGRVENDSSYYFSKYSHIWGWATWRRAWQKYDVNITSWPEIKKSGMLKNVFKDWKDQYYWSSIFDDVYAGKIDTWDYQWSYACFINNFLSAMPACNLISNIGFSSSYSTHTKRVSKFADMPACNLPFPLSHPNDIKTHPESDKIVQRDNYPFFRYFIGKIAKRLLK